jgi:hypothetical protein
MQVSTVQEFVSTHWLSTLQGAPASASFDSPWRGRPQPANGKTRASTRTTAAVTAGRRAWREVMGSLRRCPMLADL